MSKVKTIKAWASTGPDPGSIGHRWHLDGSRIDWKHPAEMTIYRTREQARKHKPLPGKLVRVQISQVRP